MSSWKAQDQEVPATNDLMEIEDLTLTAPSPLQRLLSSDDDEEQEEEEENQTDEDGEEEDEEEEEDEDDDGNDEWKNLQVAGIGSAGIVAGGLTVGLLGKFLKSSPEKRLVIEATTALTKDQKDALKTDAKVEYAEGTYIISTYKSPDAFTAAHATAKIDIANSAPQDVTEVKGGDETFVIEAGGDLFRLSDKKKWEVLTTTEPAKPTDPAKTNESEDGTGPVPSNPVPASEDGTGPVPSNPVPAPAKADNVKVNDPTKPAKADNVKVNDPTKALKLKKIQKKKKNASGPSGDESEPEPVGETDAEKTHRLAASALKLKKIQKKKKNASGPGSSEPVPETTTTVPDKIASGGV